MNKSQTAVTAILLTVMALIIWYLLWIPPQQRYELLFGSTSSNETIVATEDSYFSANVGEISSRIESSNLLFSTIVSNMSVSNALTKKLISSHDLISLDSTILYQGNTAIRLNDEYSIVELELNSASITGTPKVVVVMNGTIYYENELLSDSKISVKIPFTNINSLGKDITIFCKFNGNSLFNSQKCVFNSIKLYNYEYYEEKANDSKTFYLNPTAALSEMLELSFTAQQFNDYPITMKINNDKIFEGSINNYTNKITVDLSNININSGANIFSIESSKGAEYYLSNITFDFYSTPSGLAERYYTFDIPASALNKNNIIIYFNVTGIITPGDIYFTLLTQDALFLYPSSKLVLGVNHIEIPTRYLSEKANNLKISTPNGRIVISNIKIYE